MPRNNENPPVGNGGGESTEWDQLNPDAQEDAKEDIRDDESLDIDERIRRSIKRERELSEDPNESNVEELIASERSFRQELFAQQRDEAAGGADFKDINDLSNQLDDNEIPDVDGYDAEYQFRAHMENGMEQHDDAVEGEKAPGSIDDLKKMGYTDEQIDDWVAEGLDPLEEYKNAVPVGGGDDEYHFRAHMQNGMEQNDDDSENDSEGEGDSPESEDDKLDGEEPEGEDGKLDTEDEQSEGNGENPDENVDGDGEKADDDAESAEDKGKDFEKGETKPFGDFGEWMKDKYGISPDEFAKLPDDEREKILKEFAGMQGGAEGDKKPEEKNPDNAEGDAEKKTEEETEANKEFALVNLDVEEEAKMAAHDIAEAMFAERVAHSKNPFKRIILGNMLKEGVLANYRKKALEAIRAYNTDNAVDSKIGKDKVSEYWSKTGGIERFTKAYMEQIMPAIHRRAGESMNGYTTRTDENGEIYVVTKERDADGNIVEKRVDADKNPGAKAAIDIRKAIEAYAGGTSDLASLKEQVRRIQQGEGMSDAKLDLSIDNLVELAEAVKQRAEHAEGLANVMDGFSYINGQAMRSVRSESHKSGIEKAVEAISEKTHGLLSPEVIGSAASLMLFFADKGSRSVAKAVMPGIGGALIAGAAAGIRERGRVENDIATSSREAAMGKDVSGPEGRKGKYDRQVESTLYKMQGADVLTESLNKALEGGDTAAMQKALANINALVNISDSQKIDLIRYSSGENIEDERMNLDIARAKVEVALKKAGVDLVNSDTYKDALNSVRKEINQDMDAKAKARAGLKNKRMLAQGAKTAATSIAVGTALREVSALFNPNQVGILDHVFNKENNYDATNTPLAHFLGLKEPDTTIPGDVSITEIQKYSGQSLTQQEISRLTQQGYRVEGRDIITGGTTTKTVSVSEYVKNHGGMQIVRNHLNNGTPESNGNELRGYFNAEHGWHSGMSGESFGGGITRDFEDDMADGKVHALFSFSRGSQATPIQLSERVFQAADGSMQKEFFSPDPVIQKYLDQKMGLVEIVSESGRFADDGTPIMDVWATWPGEDITDELTDTVDTTVRRTVFDVYETITERGPDTVIEGARRLVNGIAIFPFASRKALHRAQPGKGRDGGRRTPTPDPKPPVPPKGNDPTPPEKDREFMPPVPVPGNMPPAAVENSGNMPPTPIENPGNMPPAVVENPGNMPPATVENPGNMPPAPIEGSGNMPPATVENPGNMPPAPVENTGNMPPAAVENPESTSMTEGYGSGMPAENNSEANQDSTVGNPDGAQTGEQSNSDAQAGEGSNPDTQAGEGSNPDSQANAGANPDAQANAGSNPDAQAGAQPEAQAGAQPDTQQNSNLEERFRPEGGGEWTTENLKPLPESEDAVRALMLQTIAGRRLAEGRLGANMVHSFSRRAAEFNSATAITNEQRAAIMNGHDPEDVGLPPLSDGSDHENVMMLRRVGLLPPLVR